MDDDMSVKNHYKNLLGSVYSWMTGDLSVRSEEFFQFLHAHKISGSSKELAIDLGAGNGIQSIALARAGFNVVAIDFDDQLLNELAQKSKGYAITVVNDDLRDVRKYGDHASVIVCCGDTLTHLDSKDDIFNLISEIYQALRAGGRAIFSFRDYAAPLEGVRRFIPVKSDTDRILTCVLDYEEEFVTVTDLLYERNGMEWHQKVSAYKKVRLDRAEFVEMLKRVGFKIQFDEVVSRMITVIANKA